MEISFTTNRRTGDQTDQTGAKNIRAGESEGLTSVKCHFKQKGNVYNFIYIKQRMFGTVMMKY